MIRFLASRRVPKLQCTDDITDDNADEAEHPRTPSYFTQRLQSCLVTPSARTYVKDVDSVGAAVISRGAEMMLSKR
jgi:hypothetical protein